MSLKIFITIFLILSSSFAQETIDINSENIDITNFQLHYIVDSTNKLTINEIKNKNFDLISKNRKYFPAKKTIWFKLNIKNSTNSEKKLFIHFNNCHISSNTTFYEFHENLLISQKTNYKNSKNLFGSVMIYNLNLKSKEIKEIFIKTIYSTYFFVDINIFDEYNSKKDLTQKPLIYIFMIGGMVLLAIYNLLLFIYTSYKEYLYYFLFLISSAISIFYIYNGVSDFLNIYGKKMFYFHSSIIFAQIFMIMFIKSIFEIEKNYKYLNYILNFSIFISFITIFYLIFIDYKFIITYGYIIHYYSIIIVYATAIYLYIKKHTLAKFFLWANLSFFIFITISIAYYGEYLEYNFLTYYSIGFSVLLEAIAYSALLSYRIKLLEIRNQKKRQKLFEKSKKEQMGNLVSIIAHQWKQPISIISGQVAFYDIKTKLKNKIEEKEYQNIFKVISEQLKYASDTIDEFRNFFNPSKQKRLTLLSKNIELALELLNSYFKENGVKIFKDIAITRQIEIYGDEITQVLLIILKNSVEAFKESDRKIEVIAKEDNKYIYIEIKDNAGGIPEDILPNIFNEYFSTKNEKEGTGLGLHLAKEIIEKRCNGELKVKNLQNGTTFQIKL